MPMRLVSLDRPCEICGSFWRVFLDHREDHIGLKLDICARCHKWIHEWEPLVYVEPWKGSFEELVEYVRTWEKSVVDHVLRCLSVESG